jgi:uncharacterized protein
MASLRCPTCGKLFKPEETRAMPFCSDRCRRIDLNRWLSEEIALPSEDSPEGDARPGDKDQGAD